jgi:hypothetical protein
MTRVDLPYKTICWHVGQFTTFPAASNFCDDAFRADVCTLAQWRAAVCRGGVQNPGRSWVNAPTAPARLAIIADCGFDGLSDLPYTSQVQGPCCLEWPRY